jgi:C-terminal processing protease CtpA/Prc
VRQLTRWALALALIMAPATMVAQTAVRPYEAIFQELWRSIDQQFFDPAYLGVDWASLRPAYAAKAREAADDSTFLVLMRKLLSTLPTSHLRVMPPDSSVRVGVAAAFEQIGGARVVSSIDLASDAQRSGLRPGEILLSDPSALRGSPGTTASLALRSCENRARTVKIRREPLGWPPDQPYVRWRSVLWDLAHRVGYLKVTRFDDGTAPQIDSAMATLSTSEGLIIDVRGNEGGNLSFLRLTSFLTPGPELALVLLSRPFLERYGRTPDHLEPAALAALPRAGVAYTTAAVIAAFKDNGGGAAFFTEDLGSRTYRGPVIVLTDARTASAAEGFVWSLKSRPNVTVVGRPTAGAVVGSETILLPGGWKLTLPTHAGWGPDGRIFRDQKLVPDVAVPLTRRDLCANFDSDLARALNILAAGR